MKSIINDPNFSPKEFQKLLDLLTDGVFDMLDHFTRDSYVFSTENIEEGFCVAQTDLGFIDIYKYRAKGKIGSWSYQIGQDLFERSLGKIYAEMPIRQGYKYDLAWPELVRLSDVSSVHSLEALLRAIESGSCVTKSFQCERPPVE